MKYRFLFYLLFSSALSFSQKIDNTAAFRDLGNDSYFKFAYDNDYFSANDYYYTQGYNFELTSPKLHKNPLNKLLLKLKDSIKTYGLALEHYGFTPTSIRHEEILVGDRPFAACIVLKSFAVSKNSSKQESLSSILTLGLIGPVAFGGGMQTTIHRWIGGVTPQGWDNQIQNDLLIGYQLNHEKQVYTNKYLSLNSNLNMQVGTVNTKAQAGLTLTLGKQKNVFTSKDSKYQFFIYSQPLVNVIGYDATLQGTLFNKSLYTIKASDITRVNLQNNFGVVLQLKAVQLEYTRSVLGKEFETGKYHKWGGIRIGFLM